MAVAPTGAIYKALKFDGVSSRTYGVYITGEAVYNAPERDVEMITIPGRSGSFALDNGRFENITVKYPAGIFAETEADFRDAISEFRNFLCSRKGYVRLQDEYNPNEYRMAVYKSGLEVEPAMLKAGEFEITFDCKPQRWLTSGEVKQTIANSGDTITNPTLFEASPLLEVEGYGEIEFNGETLEILNVLVGDVPLSTATVKSIDPTSGATDSTIITLSDNLSLLNVGDTITLPSVKVEIIHAGWGTNCAVSITSITNLASATASIVSSPKYKVVYNSNPITFTYGTAATSLEGNAVSKYTYTSAGSQGTDTTQHKFQVSYDGNDTITIDTLSIGSSIKYTIPAVSGDSTKSALLDKIFIDCDLGEAYGEESGVIISLNNAVQIPAILPTLAPGSNAITFDNTITDLKVKPNWWKV